MRARHRVPLRPVAVLVLLLGLAGLFAHAAGGSESDPWSPSLEATLERARDLGRPALVVFVSPGLPLQELQLASLASVATEGTWVAGVADARLHEGLLRAELGRPAALAVLTLSPEGTPLAGRAGFLSAEEWELLASRSGTAPRLSAESDAARIELARELQARGLEGQRDRVLAEVTSSELAPAVQAALLQLRLHSHLAAGEVRAAGEALDELAPLAGHLSPEEWAYDQASCAFARRELDVSLALLQSARGVSPSTRARLLEARVLHELRRDPEAVTVLTALEQRRLLRSEELEVARARLHLLDDSHGHNH